MPAHVYPMVTRQPTMRAVQFCVVPPQRTLLLTPSVSYAWPLDPVAVALHRSTCAPVLPACSSHQLLYPGRR